MFEVFRVSEGGMVEDKAVGKRCADEVKDKAENPRTKCQEVFGDIGRRIPHTMLSNIELGTAAIHYPAAARSYMHMVKAQVGRIGSRRVWAWAVRACLERL